MKLFLLFFIFLNFSYLFGQQVLYQNVFFGGVAGGTYSSGASGGTFSGNIQINNIPIGSVIKKALLFAGRHGNAPNLNIIFNGDSYILNSQNQISSNFNSQYGGISAIHVIDVSSSVTILQNMYPIYTNILQNGPSDKYSDFFLYIEYSNTSLSALCTTIILNEKNFTTLPKTYILQNLMPISINFDVGLSLYGGYICDTISDGEKIYINNQYLGVIGGNDLGSNYCGGPSGSYYYENSS